MNLYVGNLPYSMTESELEELFAEYGTVSTVNLIMDQFTGQSKCFGFLEMPTQAQAEEAIKRLNNSSLKGKTLKVKLARPKEKKRKPRRY
jgi:RNA recognition motif-containing protein